MLPNHLSTNTGIVTVSTSRENLQAEKRNSHSGVKFRFIIEMNMNASFSLHFSVKRPQYLVIKNNIVCYSFHHRHERDPHRSSVFTTRLKEISYTIHAILFNLFCQIYKPYFGSLSVVLSLMNLQGDLLPRTCGR